MSDAASGRLPNFIIAGVQKCGTTTLHRYLERNPAVFLPPAPQEICFFRDGAFKRGLAHYEAFFSGWSGEAAVGQTCPVYLDDPRVPGRIQRTLPDVRFIVILRDPVARTYSHYWHNVKKGREPLGFEEALVREPVRVRTGDFERLHYCYVARSRYDIHLRRFVELFGADRVFVLLTQDLEEGNHRMLCRLHDFLGLPAVDEIELGHHNKARLPWFPRLRGVPQAVGRVLPALGRRLDQLNRTRAYPPMHPSTRAALVRDFLPTIEWLEDFLDRDLVRWRTAVGANDDSAGRRSTAYDRG